MLCSTQHLKEEKQCPRRLSSQIGLRKDAPHRVSHTPSWGGGGSQAPRNNERAAHWRRPSVGTTRIQNIWHMDIKSRRWLSIAKQNKLYLIRDHRGRKKTMDQVITNHPILAAIMLYKPHQMSPRQKGKMRVVLTPKPLFPRS